MGILNKTKDFLTNSSPGSSVTAAIPGAGVGASAPSSSGQPSGGATSLLQAHKEATSSGSRPGYSPHGKKLGRPSKNTQAQGPTQAPTPTPGASGLFNEENTGRLVALPFTLAAVATDYPGWSLDTTEQKELAAVGSVALNEWVSIDPKWVALCLFSLSLSGMAVSKAIQYQAALRIRKMEEFKRRQSASLAAGTSTPTPGPSPKPETEIPGFIQDNGQK